MKKILCLVLALLMIFTVLVACTKKGEGTGDATSAPIDGGDTDGGNGGNGDVDGDVDGSDSISGSDADGSSDTDTTTESKETNQWGEDKLTPGTEGEDLDFQGATIGIACRPETRYIREFGVETQADPVDMKIYQRNKAVEKELNVKIKLIGEATLWTATGIKDYVLQEQTAGVESEVDVVAAYGAYATTPLLRGCYVNLADETQVSYLTLTNAYWNQSYIQAATCYNQLYYLVGDLNLTVYDKSIATFTNMDLARENEINPDDLYAAVKSGDWTYDYMYTLVKDFSYLDGNENFTVDVGDIVPLATVSGSEGRDPFVSAWQLEMLKENDDGTHTITIDGNTKLEAACTKLINLYELEGVFLTSIEESFEWSFVGGKALFDFDIIYRNADSNTALRNCGFDYAILPLPKYDKDQQGYYTTPQDAYNTMSVTTTHEDKIDAICATLELMCAKSYSDVRPFYIEKMVKATYVTGPDKVTMLDTAMAGSVFDTGTIYASQLEGFISTIWRSATMNKITIAERWEAKRTAITTAVEDFDVWFAMMDPYAQ